MANLSRSVMRTLTQRRSNENKIQTLFMFCIACAMRHSQVRGHPKVQPKVRHESSIRKRPISYLIVKTFPLTYIAEASNPYDPGLKVRAPVAALDAYTRYLPVTARPRLSNEAMLTLPIVQEASPMD